MISKVLLMYCMGQISIYLNTFVENSFGFIVKFKNMAELKVSQKVRRNLKQQSPGIIHGARRTLSL